MTRILKAEEFINESSGAALKDRTPDRFNSDKLAIKREGLILDKQWNKSFEKVKQWVANKGRELAANSVENDDGTLCYITTFNVAEFDGCPCPIGLRINIDEFLGPFCLYMNDSQRNFLQHIGLRDDDNINFGKWLAKKLTKNTPYDFSEIGDVDEEGFLCWGKDSTYRTMFVSRNSEDNSIYAEFVFYDRSYEDELSEVSPAEYVINVEQYYETVINAIADILKNDIVDVAF